MITTTFNVPCDGRATFHRLGVRALRDMLLEQEVRCPSRFAGIACAPFCEDVVTIFLRPVAYLERGLGT